MGETIRRVWIGLVEVRPKPGNAIFEGAPGAFSNVLCLGRDEAEYRRRVVQVFDGLGLEVAGIMDIERLDGQLRDRRPDYDLPEDEIRDLAGQLSETSPVTYDTFYVYESPLED